ncbi:MAG: fructose-6-phosphate aldolase [Bacteroidetes bacterium]|jgi:transaldolase|nr:fructose-6-phosphate aldolase [Bacteroidota bacterium]
MKFFLDTANLDEIQDAQSLGLLDGITTNPSLMAREGVQDVEAHYLKICQLVEGDISAEVIATDYAGMLDEGRKLARLHENIVVKIPFIKEGVRAIRTLADEGIRTNCTLIFSPMQALLAAKAGASYVSPFIGRLDDIAHDGMDLIAQIRTIFDNYGYDCEILAASTRHTLHIVQCAEEGADVVTLPYKVFMGLFNHPLTDIGLKQFLADHAKSHKV